MECIKEARRGRARPLAARALCIVLMACFLMTSLSGCIFYRSLRFPQLQEFEQKVIKLYPHAHQTAVSCKYAYGANVKITVEAWYFHEEEAYAILGYLQPIVCDEEFIRMLFELYEKESHGDPDWEGGYRPEICLELCDCGTSAYRFTTRATKETFNSALDPDDYTWDGYKTWYGDRLVSKDLSPGEIEVAVKQYSQKQG